ncbi:hypothetical protein GQ44DRAFT_800429 [Phaeosphaeriaceae sp. PMI808]|nr:hypothetical protein GQ44DRAFT_800429 [Phaeosphaeriaceae sp. PMI808]
MAMLLNGLSIEHSTVDKKPSCRIFTNYNGVGERGSEEERDLHMQLQDIQNLTIISFLQPRYIYNVGICQDAGPLENDPLISAVSEVAAIFPRVEEPDFIVSLDTGESISNNELPTDVPKGHCQSSSKRWCNTLPQECIQAMD